MFLKNCQVTKAGSKRLVRLEVLLLLIFDQRVPDLIKILPILDDLLNKVLVRLPVFH